MLQIRCSLRILEDWIHVTAECVCPTSSLLGSGAQFGLPGPANNVCSSLQPLCLFSPSLERPPLGLSSTQVLPHLGGHQSGARPTQNAVHQPVEITQLLRWFIAGMSPSLLHTHTHIAVIYHLIWLWDLSLDRQLFSVWQLSPQICQAFTSGHRKVK